MHRGGPRPLARHAREADETTAPAGKGPGRRGAPATVGAACRLVGRVSAATPAAPPAWVPVETGTVARTYPWSAGTLAIEGGVPFGVAASAGVTFTTASPRNKNRHCCWYGTSGAGKGYSFARAPVARALRQRAACLR